MFKEFRDFALRGNVVDLAIGVIIGAAFGVIVSSLVDDVFMPIIGLILGHVDFSNLFVVLSNPNNVPVTSLAAAKTAGVATLNIGLFINAVVKFVIVAFVLFLVFKGINSLKKKPAAEPAAPPPPTKEEVLLTEIRDALRASGKAKSMPMAAAKAPSVSAKPAAKKTAAKKPAAKPATAAKAPVKKAAAKKPAAKKPAAKKPAAKAAAAKKPAAKAAAKKPAAKKPAAKKPAAKK